MTIEAPPAPPGSPAPSANDNVRVRGVLRESRALFTSNARTIMLPMAAIQIPLALLGAVVPWFLYMTTYADQAEPFEAEALRDGPRGLLFALVLVGWVWMMFLIIGFAGTMIAVRNARKGTQKTLVESLDPAFTRLDGLFILGLTVVALGTSILLSAITVVGPLFLAFVSLRLGLMFHAFVLDGAKPREAMQLSWRLMHGNVYRFLALLIATIPSLVMMLLASFAVLLILSLPFALFGTGREVLLAANALGTFVIGVCVIPILAYLTTTTTVFYLTLRERTDARITA